MVEAFTLPETFEMACKPLLQQMGRSGGGNVLSGHSRERDNRWGHAPVVGPAGHLNRQIAHSHLRLRTGDIRAVALYRATCIVTSRSQQINTAVSAWTYRFTNSVQPLNKIKIQTFFKET